MFCDKIRNVLLDKGFIFEEKQIPHGIYFKFLGGLILIVYNSGSVVFQGKCNNESLKKELQSLLCI